MHDFTQLRVALNDPCFPLLSGKACHYRTCLATGAASNKSLILPASPSSPIRPPHPHPHHTTPLPPCRPEVSRRPSEPQSRHPEPRVLSWATATATSTSTAVPKAGQFANAAAFADIAISDDDDDFEEEEIDDCIHIAPTRKRKRSPSPPAPLPSRHLESFSDSSLSDDDTPQTPLPPSAGTTIHLTINVPPNHQGPLTINLDPNNFARLPRAPTAPSKRDELAQATWARLNARSASKTNRYAGFLDLPAELRNDIYRTVFVTARSVNFAQADNFSRSAALLRTSRHSAHISHALRSILYSENSFAIERRTQRYGSFWESEWREVGFLNVRYFMKSVGSTNMAFIRKLSFMLEDAVPCLNPAMRTNEERRFVHDDHLMSVLRHLGDHSQLQTLDLHFHGRRRVDRTDDRFLDYMKRIKADTVRFVDWPPGSRYPRQSKQDDSVKTALLQHCTRKRKKFDVSGSWEIEIGQLLTRRSSGRPEKDAALERLAHLCLDSALRLSRTKRQLMSVMFSKRPCEKGLAMNENGKLEANIDES
ncbi:uncharacterized protein MYCFIDRAFT_208361 [Pseudocercospora fijiensis CIRAD86]|uniref:Uncharacterized protein n=1 Tax=Pseudocercospora fijiensis (strain CIRAD86) TaxID=383855 RepID=M2YUQ6_PSEFD|nr:uncharacterized protein MYCFIDRAFT_208361 [Pseudocercospora fijiensis CIRAD86]EME81475.1 hypothetical protein MYCFIDRAFT_208361 [Pseudocercospora fijiensis CIRAD86]